MSVLLSALGFWALGGLIGYAAAQRKGWPLFVGVLAGVLLGPLFAWVLFVVSGIVRRGDVARRRCPHCAEWVQPAARRCKHCHQSIPEVPTAQSTPVQARAQRTPTRSLGWHGLVWLSIVLALINLGIFVARQLP